MSAPRLWLRASLALLSSIAVACAEGVGIEGGGFAEGGNEPSGNSSQGAANEGGNASQGASDEGGAGEGGFGEGGAGPACDGGLTDCDGDCVDLETNPAHCGSCPNDCPATLANTVATCETATCGVACTAGFADCNNDLGLADSNGCEVDTAVDTCSVTFVYTGAMQSFTVPGGTNAIQFSVAGAQGGSSFVSNTNYGGLVSGTLSVSPGNVLNIYVGGQPVGTTGGFNGGGLGETAGMGP